MSSKTGAGVRACLHSAILLKMHQLVAAKIITTTINNYINEQPICTSNTKLNRCTIT